MPRVKKVTDETVLREENEKLSGEIAKARQKIADAEAKMKENSEKIQMEQLNRIAKSGYKLDEVVKLIEVMASKHVAVQDIMSLIDDGDEKDNPETPIQNDELDKMMASLPSYE